MQIAIALLALAPAHQYEHPKVLRLGVLEDRLLINVSYDVNPGDDARLHRSLFDRDADGALDATEKSSLEKYLVDTALLFFKLSIDGTRVVPERTELVANRLDLPAGSTDSLGIAFVLAAPLPKSATFSIELTDRDKDRARHVPLIVDLGQGYEVAFASPGELFPEVRQLHRVLLREGTSFVLRLRRTRAT